MWLGGSMFTG
ncbi:proline-rich receptor-like protein kinase PERK2 [Iris pallida]|uniref:Proline-rich receptor-like protein kinase PERK2 n=1 Tax=Iris pallida TaxID=29817 RepID=A0AAX6I494_IRIPA|nr:proline-rich receptor-like protein kinase PERK2 [Iris pallida]